MRSTPRCSNTGSRSWEIKEGVFTLHHRIDVTDDRAQVVYQVQTKFPSQHDKTDITDASGIPVAHIEKRYKIRKSAVL